MKITIRIVALAASATAAATAALAPAADEAQCGGRSYRRPPRDQSGSGYVILSTVTHNSDVCHFATSGVTGPPQLLRQLGLSLRNRTRDRALKSYARLFYGTEKLLSWDYILWIDRTVLAP